MAKPVGTTGAGEVGGGLASAAGCAGWAALSSGTPAEREVSLQAPLAAPTADARSGTTPLRITGNNEGRINTSPRRLAEAPDGRAHCSSAAESRVASCRLRIQSLRRQISKQIGEVHQFGHLHASAQRIRQFLERYAHRFDNRSRRWAKAAARGKAWRSGTSLTERSTRTLHPADRSCPRWQTPRRYALPASLGGPRRHQVGCPPPRPPYRHWSARSRAPSASRCRSRPSPRTRLAASRARRCSRSRRHALRPRRSPPYCGWSRTPSRRG